MTRNEKIFINSIKARMRENAKAFSWLMEEELYSLIGSILRMELDSLIRVAYINSPLSQSKKPRLLEQFCNGQKWKEEKSIITDRKMLNNAMNVLGLGWADSIYDICCAFIHLSPYHDWGEIEPTGNLTQEERQSIVQHVKDHQHIEFDIAFNFNDLIGVAHGVFEKLQVNLEWEINKFEEAQEETSNE